MLHSHMKPICWQLWNIWHFSPCFTEHLLYCLLRLPLSLPLFISTHYITSLDTFHYTTVVIIARIGLANPKESKIIQAQTLCPQPGAESSDDVLCCAAQRSQILSFLVSSIKIRGRDIPGNSQLQSSTSVWSCYSQIFYPKQQEWSNHWRFLCTPSCVYLSSGDKTSSAGSVRGGDANNNMGRVDESLTLMGCPGHKLQRETSWIWLGKDLGWTSVSFSSLPSCPLPL